MLKKHSFWFMLTLIPVAWEWFSAGWEKIMEGGLGSTFADGLGKTLGFFEKQVGQAGAVTNPNTWYVNSFLAWGKASPSVFGYLVEYGELLIGLVLFAAVAYYLFAKKTFPAVLKWLVIICLLGGIFMNFNFYFAAAWPENAISTRSINITMGLLQLIFLGYFLTAAKNED